MLLKFSNKYYKMAFITNVRIILTFLITKLTFRVTKNQNKTTM